MSWAKYASLDNGEGRAASSLTNIPSYFIFHADAHTKFLPIDNVEQTQAMSTTIDRL